MASYAYELPFGKGKPFLNRGQVVDSILGGWQVNGITVIRGGFPTDIRVGVVPPTFATFNVPDRVSGVDMYAHNGVDQYFNPAAFRIPGTVPSNTGAPIQLFGNSARHVGRGPGSVNTDFSAFKNFVIHERYKFQFRAEAFNLTNSPTFEVPGATFGTQTFGQVTATAFFPKPRVVQFGLRLQF